MDPGLKILNLKRIRMCKICRNEPIDTELYCCKNVRQLYELSDTLRILDCSNSRVSALNNLPENLVCLNCRNCPIDSLDNLPENLQELNCSSCNISSLNNLPLSLKFLNCSHCPISSLDNLPENLQELQCINCPIKTLNNLPPALIQFNCSGSPVISVNIPASVTTICCHNCRFLLNLRYQGRHPAIFGSPWIKRENIENAIKIQKFLKRRSRIRKIFRRILLSCWLPKSIAYFLW